MRVLVLGASGMLGHRVYLACRERFDTWAAVRKHWVGHDLFYGNRTVVINDAAVDLEQAERVVESLQPDVVINCLGRVKQVHSGLASLYLVNSILPHQLLRVASRQEVRLIHFSTDCVFSGQQGYYEETDPPDPIDDYGYSKLIGEPVGSNCLVLRTSFIGRQIGNSHGLLEWALGQKRRPTDGYERAVFSGLTTMVLARWVVTVLSDYPDLHGMYHVAAEPINKLTLLRLINKAYGIRMKIAPKGEPVYDRSLNGSRFRLATGLIAFGWPRMIDELADDPTPYDRWRGKR